MDFAYSEDQEAWRETVAAFLDKHAALAATREDGFDAGELWRRMGSLGLHGLHISEQYGGQGFGLEELAIVAEEMGARVLGSPYLASTGLTGTLLSCLSSDLLPWVASGERVATTALWEAGHGWADDAGGVTGQPLNGTKVLVPFGPSADVVVVSCRLDGELALAAVDAADVTWSPVTSLDLTARYATLELRDAPATVLATGTAAREALDRATAVMRTLLAAEMIGGARACLSAAVAYAKQRHQFGKPIGSFQAIKHLCADMLAELELARSATLFAVWAVQAGDPRAAMAVSAAKALAGEAYLFIADAALHVHGGMGFTWEHEAHLHLRRARSSSLLFGDARHHREQFLRLAGFGSPLRTPEPLISKGTP
ncbi:acyl-CoA dehydrogenase family protein [Dactylosporangium sp. CS-047395]|uniref:acyl-CoA dehydrogenase family protein n=1 Tax=Dactylosporangium sp. CS-047395 TaxID=3239936 RepID=UPI003D9135E3